MNTLKFPQMTYYFSNSLNQRLVIMIPIGNNKSIFSAQLIQMYFHQVSSVPMSPPLFSWGVTPDELMGRTICIDICVFQLYCLYIPTLGDKLVAILQFEHRPDEWLIDSRDWRIKMSTFLFLSFFCLTIKLQSNKSLLVCQIWNVQNFLGFLSCPDITWAASSNLLNVLKLIF